MRWLWGTVLVTTLFWLGAVPIAAVSFAGWIWFIVAAILLAGAGLRHATVRSFSPFWLIALLPLGIAAGAVPFPYSLPAVLGCLALVLLATGRLSGTLAWVGLPVGLVALIISVQMAALPLLYIASSRLHDVSWLTPFFYGLVRIFESQASLSEGRIIIPYANDNFEFLTRPEALGLIPGALFAVGGMVLLAMARRRARAVAGFLAFVAVYSGARYILLMFLTVRTNTAGVFWLPVPVALSYLPLALALAGMAWPNRAGLGQTSGVARGSPGGKTFTAERPSAMRALPAFALLCAAGFGVIGFFAYHDAGARKQGRILIDELHSDWEWTTLKYDTQWYGRKSGYNYYCLAEYLNLHYTVEASRDSLLPELLAGYDVVMLKTPTSPYSTREIAALVEYVRQGGGLWLIGDHTNVFGTSTYLNQIAGRFGLRFRYDSTYDLMAMTLSIYKRPPIFAHPTVAFLPDFLFATSCTMDSPLTSENMILGSRLKAMRLDYGRTSFFPDKTGQNYAFGIFVQQGGVRFGKGRVAGFTDSTCFSNFFMFIPGKPELALATIEWLNRRNRLAWMNPLLLLCGLVSLAGAVTLVRRWTLAQQAILVTAAGLLGFALAVVVYDGHVRRSYGLPEPHTDFTRVAFESEHSAFTLPTRGLTKNPEVSLHTFYVWTQRLGWFPSYEQTLEAALAAGDLVVIANPLRPFRAEELEAVRHYMTGGGRLLILVDPLNDSPAQTELLKVLGVTLDLRPEDRARDIEPGEEGQESQEDVAPEVASLDVVNLEGKVLARAARPTGLSGGRPRLRLSDGRAVMVEFEVGEGRAFVFADFALFTVTNMGHTGEVPDRRRRDIFELEYGILRNLVRPE